MCNQDDNDTRNAKDTDNKRLEEGDLDACAKQIDDPQDNSTDDAVCDECPQDAKRQCNELSKDRKYDNADSDASNNIQARFPSCSPWRVRVSPRPHTRGRRRRAVHVRCA